MPAPTRRTVRLLPLLALAGLLACGSSTPRESEILWDEWGVPHVYAAGLEELGHGFGRAQMRSHGDAILRLFGLARGRAAEHWGAGYLDSDRLTHTLDIPGAAEADYAALEPEFRRYLDAFVEGMNAYAREHPEALGDELEAVLPLRPADVLAHMRRIGFAFIGYWGDRTPVMGLDGMPAGARPGSNTWAIGPSRSASGNALLLQNPHLPWGSPLTRLYEAQLVGPGVNVYGATFLGLPVIFIGFNERLGWSHTINTIDVLDTYRLELVGDGYRYDGAVRAFEREEKVLRVRRPDGGLAADTLAVRRSVHGPVVREEDGTAIAVRTPLFERQDALGQLWQMGRARDLEQFRAAVARLQVPMTTIAYADRDGHIWYLYNGQLPERPGGDWAFWRSAVPGDTSATLWTEVHAIEALPQLLDPESGFLQNSNSPPWWATLPAPFEPGDFPAYTAPEGWMLLREQRGLQMLAADEAITFDELVEMRHSSRMLLADRLLDDLLPAARAAENPRARRAADVLEAWDRSADAGSRGALLFALWAQEQCRGGTRADPCGFAVPFRPGAPLTTPDGLADPARAAALLGAVAAEMEERFGALDVPWGEVMRLSDALPGTGAPGDPLGVFHVVTYVPVQEGRHRPVHGDTWVAALEFTPEGPRGRVLLSYGNASQPGSPHDGDQLELLAREEMRPLWFTRDAVEAHVVETVPIRWEGRAANR